MKPFLSKLTVQAGDRRDLPPCTCVRVQAVTGTATISFEDGDPITVAQGDMFKADWPGVFNKITVNVAGAGSVTLVYGIGETNASSSSAPTTVAGSGIVSLADAASSAAITNVKGKQFAVRNHASSAGNLQIKDGSGNIMDVLAPGDPAWTLETSGTFILTASGGAVNYSWAKVVYA